MRYATAGAWLADRVQPQLLKELQRGGKVGEMISSATSPADWFTKARDAYDGWRYGRDTAALAAMLTRPDAASRLAGIAKAPKGSAQSYGMAAMSLLGTAVEQSRDRVAIAKLKVVRSTEAH